MSLLDDEFENSNLDVGSLLEGPDMEEPIEEISLPNLQASYRLWKWAASSGAAKKSEWPEWERNGGNYPQIRQDCFFCDVYRCRNCILDHAAREVMEDDGWSCYCLNGRYEAWRSADTAESRHSAAQAIVDLHVRAQEIWQERKKLR
jgi:hypothetical protein